MSHDGTYGHGGQYVGVMLVLAVFVFSVMLYAACHVFGKNKTIVITTPPLATATFIPAKRIE